MGTIAFSMSAAKARGEDATRLNAGNDMRSGAEADEQDHTRAAAATEEDNVQLEIKEETESDLDPSGYQPPLAASDTVPISAAAKVRGEDATRLGVGNNMRSGAAAHDEQLEIKVETESDFDRATREMNERNKKVKASLAQKNETKKELEKEDTTSKAQCAGGLVCLGLLAGACLGGVPGLVAGAIIGVACGAWNWYTNGGGESRGEATAREELEALSHFYDARADLVTAYRSGDQQKIGKSIERNREALDIVKIKHNEAQDAAGGITQMFAELIDEEDFDNIETQLKELEEKVKGGRVIDPENVIAYLDAADDLSTKVLEHSEITSKGGEVERKVRAWLVTLAPVFFTAMYFLRPI